MTDRDLELTRVVELALGEDVGAGDYTTDWTVPEGRRASAVIVAKAEGVLSGVEVATLTFHTVDPSTGIVWAIREGAEVEPGDEVCGIRGSARSILTGERVALNFLQRLSGIATLARRFVDAVEGTGATILDTRKTTPLLRALERQAVRSGGASNHRYGLDTMVLIKENHIRAAGSITAAVQAVHSANHDALPVEIETTSLDEVRKALASGVDRIMLDNMPLDLMTEAVQMIRGSDEDVEIEASGGVDLKTVRPIAETGVDFISVGALTHSAPALDLSLLFEFSDR